MTKETFEMKLTFYKDCKKEWVWLQPMKLHTLLAYLLLVMIITRVD